MLLCHVAANQRHKGIFQPRGHQTSLGALKARTTSSIHKYNGPQAAPQAAASRTTLLRGRCTLRVRGSHDDDKDKGVCKQV